MAAALRILRRYFSGRGKSATRNAIEMAAGLAAIFLVFYGIRGGTVWRIAVGTVAVAVIGFVLGFGVTVYDKRRRPGG
jgi:hypothetical protein